MKITPFSGSEKMRQNVFIEEGEHDFEIASFRFGETKSHVPNVMCELGILSNGFPTGQTVKVWLSLDKNPKYATREEDYALYVTSTFFKSINRYDQLLRGDIQFENSNEWVGRAEFARVLDKDFMVCFPKPDAVNKKVYDEPIQKRKCFCVYLEENGAMVFVGASATKNKIITYVEIENNSPLYLKLYSLITVEKKQLTKDEKLIEELGEVAYQAGLMREPKYLTARKFIERFEKDETDLNDAIPF